MVRRHINDEAANNRSPELVDLESLSAYQDDEQEHTLWSESQPGFDTEWRDDRMMFQEGENVPRQQLISNNRRQKNDNFGICRFVEGYL